MAEVEDLRVRDVQRVRVGPGEVLVLQVDDVDPELANVILDYLAEHDVKPVLIVPTGSRLRLVSYDASTVPAMLSVRVVP